MAAPAAHATQQAASVTLRLFRERALQSTARQLALSGSSLSAQARAQTALTADADAATVLTPPTTALAYRLGPRAFAALPADLRERLTLLSKPSEKGVAAAAPLTRAEGRALEQHARAAAVVGAAVPEVANPFTPRRDPVTGRWTKPLYSLRRQKELVKKARLLGMEELLPPGPKSRHLPKNELRHEIKLTTSQHLPSALPAAALDHSLPLGSMTNGRRLLNRVSALNRTLQRVVTPTARRDLSLAGTPWALQVSWQGAPTAKSQAQKAVSRMYAGRKRMFKGHKWEREAGRVFVHRKILVRDMAKRIARFKAKYRRRRPNPLKPAVGTKAAKLPF